MTKYIDSLYWLSFIIHVGLSWVILDYFSPWPAKFSRAAAGNTPKKKEVQSFLASPHSGGPDFPRLCHWKSGTEGRGRCVVFREDRAPKLCGTFGYVQNHQNRMLQKMQNAIGDVNKSVNGLILTLDGLSLICKDANLCQSRSLAQTASCSACAGWHVTGRQPLDFFGF